LYIFPAYLHTVATLPWEIQQKSHFQQYYSYILQIITLSQEKKQTVIPLPTTPEKCHCSALQYVKLLHLTAGNVAFLQMSATLKRAGCVLAFVALKMTDQR